MILFVVKMNLLSLVENCVFGLSTRVEAGLLFRQGTYVTSGWAGYTTDFVEIHEKET